MFGALARLPQVLSQSRRSCKRYLSLARLSPRRPKCLGVGRKLFLLASEFKR